MVAGCVSNIPFHLCRHKPGPYGFLLSCSFLEDFEVVAEQGMGIQLSSVTVLNVKGNLLHDRWR